MQENEDEARLVFQLNSYHMLDHRPKPGSKQTPPTTTSQDKMNWVQLYGRLEDSRSVCVHVPLWQCVILRVKDVDAARANLDRVEHSKKNLDVVPREWWPLTNAARDAEGLVKAQFLEVWCRTNETHRQIVSLFMNDPNVELVETDIPLMLRLLQCCQLNACGLVSVPMSKLTVFPGVTACDLEYYCGTRGQDMPQLTAAEDQVFPLRVLTLSTRILPNLSDADIAMNRVPKISTADVCRCICGVYYTSTTPQQTQSISFMVGEHSPLTNDTHSAKTFATERQMYEALRKFIKEQDFDVIIGWNLAWNYWFQRDSLTPRSTLRFLGKMHADQCMNFRKQTEMYYICAGRWMWDLRGFWAKNYRCRSYKLRDVAKEYLGAECKEWTQADILKYTRQQDVKTNLELVNECLMDAQFVARLTIENRLLENQVQLARVCSVFLQDLSSHGTLFPSLCMLYRHARSQGFALTANCKGVQDQTFQGGFVMQIDPRFYENLLYMDYQALYPSLIVKKNICYSTILAEPNTNCEEVCTDIGTFYYDQSQRGVLPSLMESLLVKRKQTKTAMTTETCPMKQAALNSLQLALKLAANAMYGFTGAIVSNTRSDARIAASVTACGRKLITTASAKIERELGVCAVYADTDSLFLHRPGLSTLAELFNFGKQASALVSDEVLVLKVECVMRNCFLFAKKRYVYEAYASPDAQGKLESRGGVDVKRNYPTFAQNLYRDCWHGLVMNTLSLAQMVLLVRERLQMLCDEQVPMHDLAMSMDMSSNQPDQQTIQHTIRRKMKSRGNNLPVGDRTLYVITAQRGSKTSEKAEEFEHALMNHLPLCKEYYIKQVQACLVELGKLRFASVAELHSVFNSFLSKQATSNEIRALVTKHISKPSIATPQAKKQKIDFAQIKPLLVRKKTTSGQ
jgi:DNA polymerase elongation subunit (family B)